MNPHRELGVDDHASEADIKRAYARLLKQHRPDTDPAGFQRLHEAYTHCVAHARYLAQREAERDYDDDSEQHCEEWLETAPQAELVVADELACEGQHGGQRRVDYAGEARVLDSHAPSEPLRDEEEAGEDGDTLEASFDVEAFLEELLLQTRRPSVKELTNWLQNHEALYSLQLKQFLTGPVANAFARTEALPEDEQIGVVLNFFGLDGVGRQHPWVAHSLQVLWERMEDRRAYERVRWHYTSPLRPFLDRIAFRELVAPHHWLRFLFVLLCPSMPTRVRNILAVLEQQAPTEARARVAQDRARFWRLSADRERLDRRRWLLAALRLPWVLPVAGYIAFLTRNPPTVFGLAMWVVAALAGWFALAVAYIGYRRLLNFNTERLHWDLPLVCAGGALIVAIAAGSDGRADLAGALCVLALVFWSRQRTRGSYFVSLFSFFSGTALVMSLLVLGAPLASGNWRWLLAAVYGVASVIATDVLYARKHRQTLAWSRVQLGWLPWVLSAHVVLTLASLVAAHVLEA